MIKILIILFSIILVNNCSNTFTRTLANNEYLCSFKKSSDITVDFSLKFYDKQAHIISWWINRGYKNLVVDFHDNEDDIYRDYIIDEKIIVYKKLHNNQNNILLVLDTDTLIGDYNEENVKRSKVICINDPKASYKMSLKIAIGKKNYEEFLKQKGL